jgi:hypothetical protein
MVEHKRCHTFKLSKVVEVNKNYPQTAISESFTLGT